jgi:hypothetical protein
MRSEVRFAAYRDYTKKRTEASNALMALLAGAQMASHLLKLTDGSEHLLPDIFPSVPHIRRFNLSTDQARGLLNAADEHLGAMSVPYVLAIHEDYLRTCLTLLAQDCKCSPKAAGAQAWALHGKVATAAGTAFSHDSIVQFDTLREMRNCMIHAGGQADTRLLGHISQWTAEIAADWLAVAHNDPRRLRLGDKIRFSHGELIMSLAVTKRLAREANKLLQTTLSKAFWADLVMAELVAGDPAAARGSQALKKARGLARFSYRPLDLTDDELKKAIERARWNCE